VETTDAGQIMLFELSTVARSRSGLKIVEREGVNRVGRSVGAGPLLRG